MKTKGDTIMVGGERTIVVKNLSAPTHADRYLVQHEHGGYSTVDKEGNVLNNPNPPIITMFKGRGRKK